MSTKPPTPTPTPTPSPSPSPSVDPATCDHDVVLNGACFYCGTTDLDPIAMSPKKPTGVIPVEQLIRKKP